MAAPKLDPRFFDEFSPDPSWCQKVVNNLHNAGIGPNAVPLYEWEGILYVGVASPKGIRIKEHWKLVTAPQDKLQSFWNSWFENFSSPTHTNSPELSSFTPNSVQTLNPLLDTPDPIELKDPVITTELSTEPSLHTTPEAPEGLDFTAGPPSLSSQKVSEDPLVLDLDLGLAAPDKLSLSPTTTQDENQISTSSPPPPPVLASATESPLLPNLTSNTPTSPISQPGPSWREETRVSAEHSPLKLASQLVPPFDGFAHLVLNGEWLELLDVTPKSTSTPSLLKSRLELNTPSPFKIVFKTKNDYHGPLVPSPITEKLFSGLQVSLPKHLTIVPIWEDHKVTGMILAWSSQDLSELKYLELLKKQISIGNEEATAIAERGNAA